MSNSDASDENEATGRLPRVVVDFKIPLPWLLAAAGSILWGLIGWAALWVAVEGWMVRNNYRLGIKPARI